MEDQERMLPIANVGRIMKQILPSSAKISKEGKQVMQECATEFISFVTEEASDKCHKDNRKTVNGDDICWALSALGLDHYAHAIATYLHKYRLHHHSHQPHKNPNNLHRQNINNNDIIKPHHHHHHHQVIKRQKLITQNLIPDPAIEFRVTDDDHDQNHTNNASSVNDQDS